VAGESKWPTLKTFSEEKKKIYNTLLFIFSTFDKDFKLINRKPIPNDTLLVLDPETAAITHSWGSNRFHVPHGVAVDASGNTYVTGAGLHQVIYHLLRSSAGHVDQGCK